MPRVSVDGEARPHIPGLSFEQELGRGAQGVVYRAVRENEAFAVKIRHVGARDADGLSEALRFRRESTSLARLRHKNLARIFEVGEENGLPYIVMEFVAGRPLNELIAEGPLAEEQVRRIGRCIAGALAEVGRHGLVHRDVKPKNILVTSEGDAKLIDFGFVASSRTLGSELEVVGTMRYAAPEQNGGLARPVDGRSDLYSLGAVLFECLTGRPPFVAESLGELIQLHATGAVPDVRSINPTVSAGLSAVVARLLAKDPDERIQDGEALERTLAMLDGGRSAKDAAASPAILLEAEEVGFVGRTAEMARLRAVWERTVREGRGGIVFIEGESGSGKSRLARELVRALPAPEQVLVLRSKSSPGDAVPLAAIRSAVDRHLASFESLDTPARVAAVANIRKAAGEFAPLLRLFSPRVSELLPTPEKGGLPVATQEQFLNAIASFLARLAEGAPCIYLLDDLQWLDDGSRSVLSRLASVASRVPLLVLCTARSEPEHEAAVTRVASEVGLSPSQRIRVSPLDTVAVGQLMADYLGASAVDPGLVERIALRSSGSPFSVTEYVRAMLEAGVLRPFWDRWIADVSRLEQLQLPDDVIRLVVKRLDSLSESTREVLTAAAVLGARFALHLLPSAAAVRHDRVNEAILEGRRASLLELAEPGVYAFVHDHVREALLSRLDPRSLRAAHQRCAQALEGLDESSSERSFRLAAHYANGVVEENPTRVYDANWQAAQLAFSQFAYEEAYAYLEAARGAARLATVPLPAAFSKMAGEVCARTSRVAEAVDNLEEALRGATDALERSKTHAILARVHVASLATDRAMASMEAAFSEMHRRAPKVSAWASIRSVAEWGLSLGIQRLGAGRGKAEGEERHRLSHFIDLCDLAGLIGYTLMSDELMMQALTRGLRPAHSLGPCRETVTAHAAYAVLLGVLQRRAAAEDYLARAAELSAQLGDRALLGHAEFYRSLVASFCGDARAATEIAERCRDQYGPWLDAGDTMSLNGHLQFCFSLRGYAKEAWDQTERALMSYARRNPQLLNHPYVAQGGAGPLAVIGRQAEAAEFVARGDTASKTGHDVYRAAMTIANASVYYVGRCSYGDELEQLFTRYSDLKLSPQKVAHHVRHFYAMKVLARSEQASRSHDAADKERSLRLLDEALGELKLAANVPMFRGFHHVGESVRWRLLGKLDRALAQLHKADDDANVVDSPWIAFEACRQRAFIFEAQKNREVSRREAAKARALAITHGWLNWERQLTQDFRLGTVGRMTEFETASTVLSPRSGDTSRPGAASNEAATRWVDRVLRLQRVMDADGNAPARLEPTLDELIAQFDAERGFLFLADPPSGRLTLSLSRNRSGEDLGEGAELDRAMVQRTYFTGEPFAGAGGNDGRPLQFVAAPLRNEGRLLGALYLDRGGPGRTYSAPDAELLSDLGRIVAQRLDPSR